MSEPVSVEQQKISGDLTMDHLVCDKLVFDRYGFRTNEEAPKLNLAFRTEKDHDGSYRVSLQVIARKESEYTATVRITGYFSVDEDNPHKDTLLHQNTIAILLPFARSQMTLLTTQPETTPVLLPVINVKKLIEQSKKEASE